LQSTEAMKRVAVILAVVLGTLGQARAEEQFARPAELGPTQTVIGQYAASFKLETWKKEAASAGTDFPSYVRGPLKTKFASKAIPAIIDPHGQIRILDGHHKLTALRAIQRDLGITIPVRLDIIKDYKGYSFDDYANDLVDKRGKGYFGSRSPSAAAAKVRMLPTSLDQLGDDPLRSILGVVFTKSGLEGSWFQDYVQFHLGERLLASGLEADLAARGLSIASGAAADPKVIDAVTRRVFSDPRMVTFLRDRIRPGNRTAKGALRAAVGRQGRPPAFATPRPMPSSAVPRRPALPQRRQRTMPQRLGRR